MNPAPAVIHMEYVYNRNNRPIPRTRSAYSLQPLFIYFIYLGWIAEPGTGSPI